MSDVVLKRHCKLLSFFTIIDGNAVLYHLYNPSRRNVNSVRPLLTHIAVPHTFRERILTAFHDNLGHFRLDKCYLTISNYFYWPNMYASVQHHLQNCLPCQISKQGPPPPARLQHAPIMEPLDRLVVDHIAMPRTIVEATGQEVSYCLTLVDAATQWCEIIPLNNTSAKTTALAIQRHWIPRFGVPRALHSDLGSCFTSQLFSELCALLGIDHTLASSQNHRSVSRADGIHRILLSGLRKICDNARDFPQKLPGLLLSLHSSVITTVGLSPAFMLYKREIRLPILAQLPLQLNINDRTLTDLVETTRLTNELLKQNTATSFARADKFYNRKAQTPNYKEGDHVLLYDENVPPGEMRKLHRFYRPVEIIQVLPYFTYKIKDLKTNRINWIMPYKIHASRLYCLRTANGEAPANKPDLLTSRPSPTPLDDNTNQIPPACDRAPSVRAPMTVKTDKSVKAQSVRPQMPSGTVEDNWYTISGILARRRRRDGSYEYRVQYVDNSTAWLKARDITPAAVRRFNATKRRRRS